MELIIVLEYYFFDCDFGYYNSDDSKSIGLFSNKAIVGRLSVGLNK